MSIKCDFHLHSSFSSDSSTPMTQMIEQGIKSGLSCMCFTEHMDRNFPRQSPDEPDFEVDTAAYYRQLLKLREDYPAMTLLFGIELGLQPSVAAFYKQYLTDWPFDFIIGSSHICHGLDPYYPAFYEGRSEDSAYLEYFESILENIHAFQDFQVYGHLDYTVRYGPNMNKYYSYAKFADVIDCILKELIQLGKGIELNTGGFKYGLGHPNPTEDIIKRYHELGGVIITIGSDAHVPEYIGYEFDRAASILRECGFRYYTIFQNKKAEFVKL